MRAWRIVQATVFEHLYLSRKWQPNFLRRKHKRIKERWFEPKTTLSGDTSYHAGSYLQTMNVVLYSMAALSTVPLLTATYELYTCESPLAIWALGTFLALLALILFRLLKDYARRKILEAGILSIHSCGIIWQAVVVAHYRALWSAKQAGETGYHNYTKHLSREAKSLAKHIYKIHEWVISSPPS